MVLMFISKDHIYQDFLSMFVLTTLLLYTLFNFEDTSLIIFKNQTALDSK